MPEMDSNVQLQLFMWDVTHAGNSWRAETIRNCISHVSFVQLTSVTYIFLHVLDQELSYSFSKIKSQVLRSMHNSWGETSLNFRPLKTTYFLKSKLQKMFLTSSWKRLKEKSLATFLIKRLWEFRLWFRNKYLWKQMLQCVTCAGKTYGSRWYSLIKALYQLIFLQESETDHHATGE